MSAAQPSRSTQWTLLTGMSATGKSSVVEELVARGHRAVDADYGYCVAASDGEWVWNEALVGELLATETSANAFLAGTARNQASFYDRFAHVVLLSAPLEVLLRRLDARTNNPFGKEPEELVRVIEDHKKVGPLLRAGATFEIDTNRPLDEVVDEVLHVAGVELS